MAEEFDPKVHGVGTTPNVAPASVSELYKLHVKLAEEVENLKDVAVVPSGLIHSLVSRVEMLEKRLSNPAPSNPPAPAQYPDPSLDEMLADTESPKPSSPFAPKKNPEK